MLASTDWVTPVIQLAAPRRETGPQAVSCLTLNLLTFLRAAGREVPVSQLECRHGL